MTHHLVISSGKRSQSDVLCVQSDDHHVDSVSARESRSSQLRFLCIETVELNVNAAQTPPVEQRLDGPVRAETQGGGGGGVF